MTTAAPTFEVAEIDAVETLLTSLEIPAQKIHEIAGKVLRSMDEVAGRVTILETLISDMQRRVARIKSLGAPVQDGTTHLTLVASNDGLSEVAAAASA